MAPTGAMAGVHPGIGTPCTLQATMAGVAITAGEDTMAGATITAGTTGAEESLDTAILAPPEVRRQH